MFRLNRATEINRLGLFAKRVRGLVCIAVFAFVAAGSASQINADPVLTFNPSTGSSGTNNNQSVGWQFNVTSTITITGLGWYDDGGNGLATGHTVGIWNPAGALITSVFVPAGTVAALDGQFRTIFFAPIVLNVGSGYIVGGENFVTNPERLAFNVSQTLDPRIAYVDATFSALGSGFVRPTQFSTATTGFYGPSFSIAGSSAAIPEPATIMLLGTGLVGTVAAIRKRRRARNDD